MYLLIATPFIVAFRREERQDPGGLCLPRRLLEQSNDLRERIRLPPMTSRTGFWSVNPHRAYPGGGLPRAAQ